MGNEDKVFLTPCGPEDTIKDFLSIDDLIMALEKNEENTINPLRFNKDEMIHAKEFLRYTNYYTFVIYRKQLTPYKNKISDKEGEQYSFTDCLSLYYFDSYLREQLNYFTGIIECFLKATFVSSACEYYTGDLNKAEFYLDKSIYRSEESYNIAMDIFVNVARNNNSLTVSHHREKKNNKFPFWVLVDELTFGEITKIISGINQEYIDFWVINSFLESQPDRLKNFDDNIKSSMFGWFQSVWHIRNVCAHYSRIYGTLFKIANPAISAKDKALLKKNKQSKMVSNNQLMAYLLAFKNILAYHSLEVQLEWDQFIISLKDKMERGEHIYANKLGLIDNWDEYLKIDIYEKV